MPGRAAAVGEGGGVTLHPDIERVALLGWRCAPTVRASRKGFFKGYVDQATANLDTLERWAHEYPGCNWCVVPDGSGIFALDVDIEGPDHAHDGVTALRDLCALHGPLPERPHGRSGGGGHLLIFRSTAPIGAGSGRPVPGVDCLTNRATMTIAPSRHRRTGDAYRWVVAPWELSPPAAPEWLLSLLAVPKPAKPRRPFIATEDRAINALMRSFNAVAHAGPGQRNAALLRRATLLGGYVAAGMIDQGQAMRELIAVGTAAGQSLAEARSTVASGIRRGLSRPIEGGRA